MTNRFVTVTTRSVAVVLLAAAALLSGCYAQRTAAILPGTNLAALRVFRIAMHGDDTAGIGTLIAADLRRRGFEVVDSIPSGADPDRLAVVHYDAQWFRDVSSFLSTLKIDLREPRTNLLLASGQSYRTSYSRQAPDVVVREVLDEIFGEVTQ